MNSKDFSLIDVTVPFKDMSTEKVFFGTRAIYQNWWWLCEDGDPKRALIYKERHPQCNSYKRTVEILLEEDREASGIKGLQVTKIPIAYVVRKDL